jgi:adenylate cyclase
MRSRFQPNLEFGQWVKAAITAIVVAAIVLALRAAGSFQLWELVTLDRFFRSAPLQPAHGRILIVAIDEEFIKSSGQWPVPDSVLAQAIEKISEHDPVAIGLDVYRDLPVSPGHQHLIEVYANTPNLIGIEKVTGDRFTTAIAPPHELKVRGQVAFNDVLLDRDAGLRRALLSIRTAEGEFIPVSRRDWR